VKDHQNFMCPDTVVQVKPESKCTFLKLVLPLERKNCLVSSPICLRLLAHNKFHDQYSILYYSDSNLTNSLRYNVDITDSRKS